MTQERFDPDVNSQKETNEMIRSKPESPEEMEKKDLLPRLEAERLGLNTDKEGLANYIEKIRHADPNEKFPIFHGTRGGYSEIPSILQSEEKGVRGGKVGRTPTYALYPVAAYWIQADSAGFKYTFERRQIQLPGDPETLDTVVGINEEGSVFITKGLEHLSFVDFEGEVLLGPRAQAPPEIAKNIQQALSHVRKMTREIRPVMRAINEEIETSFDLPANDEVLEGHHSVKELREKLFFFLPLTYKQYQDKTYEQKLATITEYAIRGLDETQRVLEREQDFMDQLKKDGSVFKEVLAKVNSRARLLWLSQSLTRRFIEKEVPEIIKKRILDTLRGKKRGGDLAEEVKSKILSYASLNGSQINFADREIEKCQKKREYYVRAVRACSKVKEILQFYEATFAEKMHAFNSGKTELP